MEILETAGEFTPPTIRSMEEVMERGLALNAGMVLMDLWDIERFFNCPRCGPARAERIRQMNLSQTVLPPVTCDCLP